MPPSVVPGSIHPAVAALLDAARRAARGGAPRSLLALHLSAIASPRPHHARVARAILHDIAQRLDGEVLRLPTGDLVLICRHLAPNADPVGPDGLGPEGLPAVLTRLFAPSAPHPDRLYTRWRLPQDMDAVATFLTSLSDADATIAPRRPGIPASPAETPPQLRRQTAVRFVIIAGVRQFQPCFTEIIAPAPFVEHWSDPANTAFPDPFLARHDAARLDGHMLIALAGQIAAGVRFGGFAAGLSPRPMPLHLNLSTPGVLSEPFAVLARSSRSRGIPLGVELSLMEAIADPEAFAAARCRLEQLGATFILDEVCPAALALTRPGELGATAIKLAWTPDLPALDTFDRSAGRFVLNGADSQAALVWGLAQGIMMFQGRHVDAMLAAERITGCLHAAACSMVQCMARAAAIEPAGQAGCADPALLGHHAAAPAGGLRP